MNRILSDSLALARESLDAAGIELVTDRRGRSSPRLNIDGNMMREVFLNIIINARNAMRKKRGTLRVSSWSSPRSNRSSPTGVRIAFSDTGPGIPEGGSAEIFEPFFSSTSKGLGLGLSISQRICRAHGGLISATNNADGGSPVHRDLADSAVAHAPSFRPGRQGRFIEGGAREAQGSVT